MGSKGFDHFTQFGRFRPHLCFLLLLFSQQWVRDYCDSGAWDRTSLSGWCEVNQFLRSIVIYFTTLGYDPSWPCDSLKFTALCDGKFLICILFPWPQLTLDANVGAPWTCSNCLPIIFCRACQKPNRLYHRESKRCFEKDDTPSVCGRHMAIWPVPSCKIQGYCECDYDNHDRLLIYHPETKQCYFIYDQVTFQSPLIPNFNENSTF